MKHAFEELMACCKQERCEFDFLIDGTIRQCLDGAMWTPVSPEDLAERVQKGGTLRCLRELVEVVQRTLPLKERPNLRAVVEAAKQYLADSGKE